MNLRPGLQLTVFSINRYGEHTQWARAGIAWINRDGSINLRLDVLPLQGELHLREKQKEDQDRNETNRVVSQRAVVSSSNTNNNEPAPLAAADASASMGGH